MRRIIVGLVAGVALLLCGATRADTIFSVFGSFSDPDPTPFSGFVTIDTQDGEVTDLDIDVEGLEGFYPPAVVSALGDDIVLSADNGVGTFTLYLTITPTTPGTLVGFMGGPIISGVVTPFGNPSIIVFSGATGTLAVPEPATLALVGFGLSGLALTRRRRTR